MAHDVAKRKNTSSLGAGGVGFTTHPAQQRVSKRLLCLDIAKLGTRSIHSVPWRDAVAGMAMALCFVGLFDALFVCRSSH